jgi:S1-C subfamily serine protease
VRVPGQGRTGEPVGVRDSSGRDEPLLVDPDPVVGQIFQELRLVARRDELAADPAVGVGSGVVVDTDGLILTNRHVVEGASSVTVEFSSGETRTATVLDVDSTYDLALLQVAGMPAGVAAATLGDSDDVEVGATAIAIGSPFGLEQSVTQGIVSAVDRTWLGSGTQLDGLIQTDTPINPGNSGGPLLNEVGEVIGINTMIESPVEGNVGVGFALPINVAVEAFAQLEAIENVDA